MTKQELIDIFEKAKLSEDEVSCGDFDGKELGLGECKEVGSTGGMDEGSNYSVTFHAPDIDLYFKISGHYQSHYGTDFYGWDQSLSIVRPVEKTITIYE